MQKTRCTPLPSAPPQTPIERSPAGAVGKKEAAGARGGEARKKEEEEEEAGVEEEVSKSGQRLKTA